MLLHNLLDSANNLLRLLVLDETSVGLDYAMRACGIHARENLTPAVGAALARCKRRCNLVAVVIRVVHAENRSDFDIGETSEQIPNELVFSCKLFVIGHVNAGASTTLFRYSAYWF